ncbi:MAG: hypothetical protein JSU87_01625 [Gemmatimonadota bacterium]|nr:MAG: hypothetical protein JSU87_01625 [Gemmatimonadota bacterium]
MSYPVFLLQWYNWPYLLAVGLALLTLARPQLLSGFGRRLGSWLGVERLAGHTLVRVFTLASAVVGLTLSGAIHDYWPAAQERAFLPGLIVTLAGAALLTRVVGRYFQRHFPEIKAVRWGGPGLSGRRGRVVSQTVSRDYKAGRAQVMGEDETLHVVMCKTREEEIPYGSLVALGEYDQSDGRYYVESVDEGQGRT